MLGHPFVFKQLRIAVVLSLIGQVFPSQNPDCQQAPSVIDLMVPKANMADIQERGALVGARRPDLVGVVGDSERDSQGWAFVVAHLPLESDRERGLSGRRSARGASSAGAGVLIRCTIPRRPPFSEDYDVRR